MYGITPVRRMVQASAFVAVSALAVPLGLISVSGCGSDAAPEGSTVKDTAGQQQGIDAMKNFMGKQQGSSKK